MAFTPVYGFNAFLTAATTAGAGMLKIDPNIATALATKLGANYTIVSLSDGVNYELVRIDSVTSPYLNVTRAFDGTTSFDFPIGACIRFQWTADGITAVAAGITFTVTGTHQANVTNTGPNSWNVDVVTPTITGTAPIEVLGTYPTLEIAATTTFGGCCCGGGGGGGTGTITSITGSGLVTVTGGTGPTANIDVPTPTFIGAGTVTVTGSWPIYTITGSGGGGGGGVASVTGSAKILLSGTPTNPVINLVTTGAGGSYNGVTYDAWGTITSVNASYHPLTTVTSGNTLATITYPTVGTVDITYAQANLSDLGLIKLAAPNATASSDPSDATSAVTPAGINAVIGTLSGVTIRGSGSFTADVPSAYTNTLGSAITFTTGLASGHWAMLTATVAVSDSALAAGASPSFGIAIFQGTTLVQGIKAFTTGFQTVQVIIPGPITVGTTYTLKSTTLTGTSTVLAEFMSNVNN